MFYCFQEFLLKILQELYTKDSELYAINKVNYKLLIKLINIVKLLTVIVWLLQYCNLAHPF